jgi:hypothetical protein
MHHRQSAPDSWRRDGRILCPPCNDKFEQRKDKPMASTVPSNAKALREMYNLLEAHFDTEKGNYSGDYSDARIASETGLAEGFVKDCRVAAYGKLLPPSALDQAVRDLRELESLFLKTESEFREKMKDLQARVRGLQKRFD